MHSLRPLDSQLLLKHGASAQQLLLGQEVEHVLIRAKIILPPIAIKMQVEL